MEGKTMKVAIGSDHAGLDLKERIKQILTDLKVEFTDFGTNSHDSCDYPDYARKVAESVAKGEHERGLLCCGSGIGVSIVANKVRGVRAALVHDTEAAVLSRQHNDANVLCLPGRTLDVAKAPEIISSWLKEPFEGGRHATRVAKIEQPRQGEGDRWTACAHLQKSEP
jgi:ribose 5-phosphate isomerase B